jgi:hypothetical protein
MTKTKHRGISKAISSGSLSLVDFLAAMLVVFCNFVQFGEVTAIDRINCSVETNHGQSLLRSMAV